MELLIPADRHWQFVLGRGGPGNNTHTIRHADMPTKRRTVGAGLKITGGINFREKDCERDRDLRVMDMQKSRNY